MCPPFPLCGLLFALIRFAAVYLFGGLFCIYLSPYSICVVFIRCHIYAVREVIPLLLVPIFGQVFLGGWLVVMRWGLTLVLAGLEPSV